MVNSSVNSTHFKYLIYLNASLAQNLKFISIVTFMKLHTTFGTLRIPRPQQLFNLVDPSKPRQSIFNMYTIWLLKNLVYDRNHAGNREIKPPPLNQNMTQMPAE
jgi:hypothetical protein